MPIPRKQDAYPAEARCLSRGNSPTSVQKRAIRINNRVLIVGEFGSINGGENSLLAIAPRLMELGWQLSAAVPGESEFAAALESAGIEVQPWSVRNADNSRKSAEQISSQLCQAIANANPAILHFNSLSTSRIGGPIARELNIPSLGYIRDIMKLSKKAISDLNKIDRIVAVSNATRQWHIDQGIEPARIVTVYNGVDTELFRPLTPSQPQPPINPIDIRNELSIPPQVPVLVFVGQIGMRKGVDILIESFFQVAGKTDAHLLVIGERHSQKDEAIQHHQNLITAVDSSAYRQRVHWLGRRTDVAEIMPQATMLIHPARQEPLGRVLLESAASGLPIVTTNVGGSAEILDDNEEVNGINLKSLLIEIPALPENETVDPAGRKNELNRLLSIGLSERILELLQTPNKLAQVSQQLRFRAVNAFSIESCASQIDSHYKCLAATRQ